MRNFVVGTVAAVALAGCIGEVESKSCEGVSCDGGQVCEEGACVAPPCARDEECGAGRSCQAGRCGTCVPRTCADAFPRCGSSVDDGCGGAIDCPAEVCGPGQTCEAGCCRQFTCEQIPGLCGTFVDACGQELVCPCAEGLRCAAEAGQAGACVCDPRPGTCEAGSECGVLADGCGGEATCGCAGELWCEFQGRCAGDPSHPCSADGHCGADGPCSYARCACATCSEPYARCGSFDDGCGTTLACGGCGAGERCDEATHVCVPEGGLPTCFEGVSPWGELAAAARLDPASGVADVVVDEARGAYGPRCPGELSCAADERCVADQCVRERRYLYFTSSSWDDQGQSSPGRVQLDAAGEVVPGSAVPISAVNPGSRGWSFSLSVAGRGRELFFGSSKRDAHWWDPEIYHAVALPYSGSYIQFLAPLPVKVAVPWAGGDGTWGGDPANDADGVTPRVLLRDGRTLLFVATNPGTGQATLLASRRATDDPGDEVFSSHVGEVSLEGDLPPEIVTTSCDGGELLWLREGRLRVATIESLEPVRLGPSRELPVAGIEGVSAPRWFGFSLDCRTLYIGDRDGAPYRARACP